MRTFHVEPVIVCVVKLTLEFSSYILDDQFCYNLWKGVEECQQQTLSRRGVQARPSVDSFEMKTAIGRTCDTPSQSISHCTSESWSELYWVYYYLNVIIVTRVVVVLFPRLPSD